jgi:hypothetical protein
MTHRHLSQLAALSLVLGACGAEPGDHHRLATTTSAVTMDDVDFAPECEGILGYVNWASLGELDGYLPSNVAAAIVQRRAAQPFTSIEDLSSVSGIAQARLEQITGRARTLDFIDADCAGVYEELAVSYHDRAAILTYANIAAEAELWDVVRTEPNTVAPLLVARRPFTTLQYLVDTHGVGPSTFRSIRDAAVTDPFDELVGRVNATSDVDIRTAFNWYAVAGELPGHPTGMLCFGVPAELVTGMGGQMRPNLATGSEVLAEVTGTVDYADRFNQVGDATAGLAHLAAQVAGQTFFGCYLSFEPNPWCGVNRAFYVNKVTGYRVLTEIRWCE